MSNEYHYPKIDSNANFAEIDKKIINYWKQYNIFTLSITSNDTNNEFIFYDGPPFANGLPHYGHLLTGFIKDLYARYQTMQGKKVERRFGWDCHGLPAEMAAEKDLNISGRQAIINFGIDKFNECCRTSVLKYSNEWQQYVERQARWVDFVNDYKTMDLNFMESVLWAFKSLYTKGYIYQSLRVMPYSWACQTPLSNFETRLDNSYRVRVDKSITVKFELLTKPQILNAEYDKCYLLVWTTTPWTLPSNLALAVGSNIEYSAIIQDNNCYILANFAFNNYTKEFGEGKKISTFKGSAIEKLKYKPLFNYFAKQNNAFTVLSGNFIVEGEGTGIVHIAPGFGEEDQLLCQQNDIDIVCPIDNGGYFTDEVAFLSGVQVFDANDLVIHKLKQQNNLIRTEQYSHNYPHCWRTDTPLIYKAVSSWYVKVTSIRERMCELNQQINWVPTHIKDGLFGKWLEGAKDWSISRNRFWGTPLPIWESDNPQYPRMDVYGSISELEKDFKVKIFDLHRPFIDQLTRPNPDDPSGKSTMRRVEDVFDCWFESGSMPYAQVHYPFENKEWFESHFPADFIVEYLAQTRGWFYTLMVLSTALFDSPPFKNCICHGVILDTKGQKLSKRLNNYPDPLELFDKYGADAMRFTMLSSSVTKGEEFLIDSKGKLVFDTLRLCIRPIWQAYHFFTTYANTHNIKAQVVTNVTEPLDCYILSKLKTTVIAIKNSLDSFDSHSACQSINIFFESLNNWYIRRSRERFNSKEQIAYDVLYTCLIIICRASAPILPILTEEIYLGLIQNVKGKSVHLTTFPDVSNILCDDALLNNMDLVRDICSNALFIRNKHNIRVRQPLKEITICGISQDQLNQFIPLIKEEINVKNIKFIPQIDDFASFKVELNLSILGKRLGKEIPKIVAAVKNNQWKKSDDKLLVLEQVLYPEEYSLTLEARDSSNAIVLPQHLCIIILDLHITTELYEEGIARDIIRIIQQSRKDMKLVVQQKINIEIISDSELLLKLTKYNSTITTSTSSRIISEISKYDHIIHTKIDKFSITIKFEKLT